MIKNALELAEKWRSERYPNREARICADELVAILPKNMINEPFFEQSDKIVITNEEYDLWKRGVELFAEGKVY